jgi:hypothetical protein
MYVQIIRWRKEGSRIKVDLLFHEGPLHNKSFEYVSIELFFELIMRTKIPVKIKGERFNEGLNRIRAFNGKGDQEFIREMIKLAE